MKKKELDYIEYKTLIRNGVPDLIEKTGKDFIYFQIPEVDFENELILKIQEESGEYLEHKNKEELADMLEIFLNLLDIKKYTFNEIDELRQKKMIEKGDYSERYFLVKVEK